MEEIKGLIHDIDVYTEHIFEHEFFGGVELKRMGEHLEKVYMDFLNLIPSLNKIGMNIDKNLVLGQISNLTEAIKRKDLVLLFDTLRYEILDTLHFYCEVRELM